MLKIDARGWVKELIGRYTIWCTYQNMYVSHHEPIMMVSEDGIPCYDHRELEKINQHTNSLIAINCLTEGIHSIKWFKQYEKSNHYLIFVNGTWDKDHYDIGINYDIMNHLFFINIMLDGYFSPNRFSYYLEKEYVFSDKPTIFISTIGMSRPERAQLVDSLLEKIEYDNYILKYSGRDIHGSSDGYDCVSFLDDKFNPYEFIIPEYYHTVSETVPINLFNQAYFNLITETEILYQKAFFLSEKTIKNLFVGMPFVIVASPHFLKNLKKLGFETYSSLWDEGYDDIEDYDKRCDKIVELCNNLGAFDWQAHRHELMQIGHKNQLNLLNLNRIADIEFEAMENTVKKISV